MHALIDELEAADGELYEHEFAALEAIVLTSVMRGPIE
jgi:hypothetical protein